MRNTARTLFLVLPLVFLSACESDPVSSAPPMRGAVMDEAPAPQPPAPPTAVAGGNTMGSGT
jgi:hypothetical protein